MKEHEQELIIQFNVNVNGISIILMLIKFYNSNHLCPMSTSHIAEKKTVSVFFCWMKKTNGFNLLPSI